MSNKLIDFKLFYNRKNHLNAQGTAIVQIQAIKDRERKYFNTGIHITPEQWDAKKDKVNKTHPHYIQLNDKIEQQILQYKDLYYSKSRDNENYSLEDLKRDLENKGKTSFTKFAFDYLEDEKKSLASGTVIKIKRSLKAFTDFNKGNVNFSELNYKLIDSFRLFLSKTCQPNTQRNYFKHLSKYIKKAISRGLLDYTKNPLLEFKIKSEATKRGYLDETDLHKIEQLEFPKTKKYLEIVRDLFLFECYTGLRFSDASVICKKHIKETNEGLEIRMVSQKENKEINLPLRFMFKLENSELSKPEILLKKYWRVDNKPFFLSEDSQQDVGANNQYTNRVLKEIQKLADIQTNLTNHIGRHTFATYLVSHVPLPVVQNLLQHSKIETTMIYIEVGNNTVKKALKTVNWF